MSVEMLLSRGNQINVKWSHRISHGQEARGAIQLATNIFNFGDKHSLLNLCLDISEKSSLLHSSTVILWKHPTSFSWKTMNAFSSLSTSHCR